MITGRRALVLKVNVLKRLLILTSLYQHLGESSFNFNLRFSVDKIKTITDFVGIMNYFSQSIVFYFIYLLFFCRLVIMNLVNMSNGKSQHVPYRDSKLTFLLQVDGYLLLRMVRTSKFYSSMNRLYNMHCKLAD